MDSPEILRGKSGRRDFWTFWRLSSSPRILFGPNTPSWERKIWFLKASEDAFLRPYRNLGLEFTAEARSFQVL